MTIDRRTFVAAPLGAVAAASTLPTGAMASISQAGASPPLKADASIRLWPGEAAGLTDRTLDDRVRVRGTDPAYPDRWVDRVRNPRLDVFRPARPNGGALLVIPGGGYSREVLDKEGYELAPWLTGLGLTIFVLVYRLPGEGWENRSNVALADAQRAMRVIRARANEYRIDPKRVGVMGFSAGGHLCADLATRFGRSAYRPVDATDGLDPRPLVATPIYPVVSMDLAIAHKGSRNMLLGPNPSTELQKELSPHLQVTDQTPPCFLLHSEDDDVVPVENTIVLRAALRAAQVPVETHLFETGGHGYSWGRLTKDKPTHIWPELWSPWARRHGLFG